MNICLIAGQYSQSSDGIGTYTSNLKSELESINEDLNVALIPEKDNKFYKSKPALTRSFSKQVKQILKPLEIEYYHYKRFSENKYKLKEMLKNTRADIYHAISPSEAIAPVLLNKRPLVTTIHDIIPLVTRNRFFFEKNYFSYYLNIAKKSDIIVTDSKKTMDDLIQIIKIPENKIRVVYPGIDTKKYYASTKSKNTIKKILYLGGLTKRKGIYETLYAFIELLNVKKDIKLLIGGGGDEKLKLEEKVKQFGIQEHVEFLGFIKESEMTRVYQNADLFVYPSKYEGFGYTPLEAMASGTPVITSNTSSIPEVVGDAAITINPNNIKDISNSMLKVISNEKLQKEMITKGIIQANKFDKKIFASEMLKIYKSLL